MSGTCREAHEGRSKSRHTPHLTLLALLPIQYPQRSFPCLFVVVKTHVGRELHGHLACAQVSRGSSIRAQFDEPKGPIISTVFGSSVVVTSCLRLAGTSRNLISTPWGSDKGALPIRDLHLGVLENSLDVDADDRAGTRKSGSSIETFLEHARRQLDLSIMM